MNSVAYPAIRLCSRKCAINSVLLRNIHVPYTVHGLLIFSWSDTCWKRQKRRIWTVNAFWFC